VSASNYTTNLAVGHLSIQSIQHYSNRAVFNTAYWTCVRGTC